jgi:hypothetical protein
MIPLEDYSLIRVPRGYSYVEFCGRKIHRGGAETTRRGAERNVYSALTPRLVRDSAVRISKPALKPELMTRVSV